MELVSLLVIYSDFSGSHGREYEDCCLTRLDAA